MSERTRVEDVLRFLEIRDRELLQHMRAEGLFESDELTADECEEFRIAVELMRELGVNAAGVEVILRLRGRLMVLQNRAAEALRILLEERESG
jgi:hypothetical protein